MLEWTPNARVATECSSTCHGYMLEGHGRSAGHSSMIVELNSLSSLSSVIVFQRWERCHHLAKTLNIRGTETPQHECFQ